jgi:predicted enzyme related to lactoylglutathione lyase
MTENKQAHRDSDKVVDHLFGHRRLSYMQIPAVDVVESAKFYEFGWQVRGGRADHFSFADATGDIGAWITDLGASREPGVLPYIYVHGIDAILERIVVNGGGDLWVATFRDPAGNVIGVWQHGPR